MKRKALTYFLVIVAIGIWFSIYKKLADPADSSLGHDAAEPILIQEITQMDTTRSYDLEEVIKDPFFPNTRAVVAQNSERTQSMVEQTRKNRPNPDQRTTTWPAIVYTGMVKNHSTDEKLAMVNVDGSDQLLREGQEMKGYKVLSISSEELKISDNKNFQVYARTN